MDALGWLLEQGGPVVRYRTAVELAGDKPYGLNLEALEGDLPQYNTVRRRLGNLRPYEEMVERRKRGEGLGVRMGLGEDRRRPAWREVESTFWMLSIRQEMEKSGGVGFWPDSCRGRETQDVGGETPPPHVSG